MNRCVSSLALAMTLVSGQSIADPQYYDTIEAASKIGGKHVTRLQRDSVTRFGELLRFEVRVAWKNPEERPENEAPLRVVRYLAKCESKELAVAAVAVFDTSSRVVKSFGVPPGAWDYASPDPGSPQEEWLASACRMPV
ncbi:MAG: hypothetical protein JNL33_02765 [Betaproteobacteria bacterium]|nr:hypothetical protein [Betaproteobacteria bacterium]MBL8532754.1 hypothetical protein [Betaproteobacteria bacterium]